MTQTDSLKTSVLRIAGMDCAEEVSVLRKSLGKLAGIVVLRFDVMNARLTLEYDPSLIELNAIHAAIREEGMRSEEWSAAPATVPPWWTRNGRLVCSSLSAAALSLAVIDDGRASREWLLALLTQGDSGSPAGFYRQLLFGLAIVCGVWFTAPKAWRSLKAARPDMNLLLLLSVFGAAVLGEFSEAATVSFLFSVSALLEGWSMGRARKAIQVLLGVTPKLALVRHGDHEHRVAVETLRAGAIVIVKPGEKIPCDGEVLAGQSQVNQSLLTGESIPVLKRPGDAVQAGTLNCDGALDILVSREANDSTLARVLRMVEESQHRRAPVEHSIEKFARYYTPVVMGAAVLIAVVPGVVTGNYAHWFYQAMVALLIACPCAFVISTPVALSAALCSAAGRGVLVKGGAFLEALARLKVLAFDKTGVLTSGEPHVRNLQAMAGFTHDGLLDKLLALEKRSEHPLGQAINRYAELHGASNLTVGTARTIPGHGICGEVAGEDFWVGSLRLSEGVLSDEVLETIRHTRSSVVFCGSGTGVQGVLDIHDEPRPESALVVRQLRDLDIPRIVMLTGDGQRVAGTVAAAVGIDHVHSELLPTEKAALVAKLQGRYGLTAMVGDGINDAEAIAVADVGIAMGRRGTDVALETSDVVLMSDNLEQLPFLIQHARRTLTIIRQNITFALLMKAVFLVLAARGTATLWMAIAADTGATLVVIFNGLRLLRARSVQKRAAR